MMGPVMQLHQVSTGLTEGLQSLLVKLLVYLL